MKEHAPSSTALLVALGQLCVGRRHPGLVDDESLAILDALLSHAPPPWRAARLLARGRAPRAAIVGSMDLVLPVLFLHQAARKRLLEREARAALAAGCARVVVVGAGLDTLGLRLARHVPVVECDHPATQAIKRGALARWEGRVPAPAGVTLVGVDLARATLAEALAATPAFDARTPTLFVVEGVLMYFAPDRVERLLRELHALAAPGSRVLLTCLESTAEGGHGFRGQSPVVDAWLSRRSEPFRWSVRPGEGESALRAWGWEPRRTLRADALRAAAGLDARAPLAEGEIVCVCDRAEPLTHAPHSPP